ncbi:Tad domain-containing protein [Erythrobacter sp. HKB08]|uniref:Tad domain-containing protein n=1 Tax=Erythrobacter sp. HKB08 TaxID=2502843 RepID=UPI0010090BF3|nr:Tad domain-containing protein [Erythrobacter sp. HKB08]
MIEKLRKLWQDRRGNVLMISAIGAASMVGAAGIGVDTVQWYLWNRQLQQAVDSGAMAGAYGLHYGTDVTNTATGEIDRNFVDAFNVIRIVHPPQEGAYTGDTGAVEIVATTSQSLPFSSLFMDTPPTIRVRSVAATVAGGEHCVIALAENGTGIYVHGNADVNLGCGAAANSRVTSAVDLTGTSWLNADPISAVGGISYSDRNIPDDATLLPYGLPVEDPLASRGLDVPTSPAGCTYNNFTVQPNRTETIFPGRYCNGIALKGNVTMSPGVYIIDRGFFDISSQADVVGEGVTIILTGNSSSNIAELKINGGAKLDLRAPTKLEDPDWYNILFFQDPMGSSVENVINGGSDLKFKGVVYLPNGNVRFNGNAGQNAECLLLVAHRVNFSGTSALDNDCPADYDDVQTRSRIIRVVE